MVCSPSYREGGSAVRSGMFFLLSCYRRKRPEFLHACCPAVSAEAPCGSVDMHLFPAGGSAVRQCISLFHVSSGVTSPRVAVSGLVGWHLRQCCSGDFLPVCVGRSAFRTRSMELPERLLRLHRLRAELRETILAQRAQTEKQRMARKARRENDDATERTILRFAWVTGYDVESTISLLDMYWKTPGVSRYLGRSWQTLRKEDRWAIVVTLLSRRSIEDTEAVILDDTWEHPSRLQNAWILDTEYRTVLWVQSLNAAGLTPASSALKARFLSLLGAIPLPYRPALHASKNPVHVQVLGGPLAFSLGWSRGDVDGGPRAGVSRGGAPEGHLPVSNSYPTAVVQRAL